MKHTEQYICHGRKSNLVEFPILTVESPIGVSTSRKLIGLSTKINLVESPIGVSMDRKSNLGHLGIALGSEIYKDSSYFNLDPKTLDEVMVLQALDAGTNWAVVTNKCCCRSIGVSCSTKCHV